MEAAAVSSTCSAIFPTILEHLCSCVNYKDIAEELKRNMDVLAAAKADMERTVEAQEIGHRQERTAKVETWTRTVNDIQVKVEKFYASYNSRSTPCLASCWKRYRLGRKASHLLKQVQEWRSHEANLGPLVAPAQPSRVEDLPCPPTAVARPTKMLEEVLVHLSDGKVNTVGIYGMGGSGKTTLLKQINKELLIEGTDFDLVILVEVHRKFDVKYIQDQVAKRVGLDLGDEDESARARALSEALSRVKFLLLLDDVWERVNLNEIGIPYLTGANQCKMVVTTRTLEVCGDMGVQKSIKMKLLDGKQSCELFKQMINDDNLLDSPAILPYAESIVGRCCGLPLALITVGRAMSIQKTADEWKWSDAQMRRSFNEIRGMDGLVETLKFTFNQLEDKVKRCFLYGALLPNYEVIPTENLINWWIGEGFLGADDCSIVEARLEGRIIIRKLISACLLEPFACNSIVGIHDVVHDMASSMSQPGEEFCTLQHNRDGSSSKEKMGSLQGLCRTGKRICIRTSDVNYMPADDEKLECPNLQTLILNQSSKIKKFPNDDFFLFMPLLRVLDLFLSSITELPSSVGSLVELRHLNLSRTHIRSLPSELGKATKLRTLNLTDTVYLKEIPCRAISGLVMLQELDMASCGYDWVLMETLFEQPSLSLLRSSPEASADASREAPCLIRDLDRLRHLERLECLGITVKSSQALELILRYPECASTITSLCIGGDDSIDANHLSSAFTKFSNMRRLGVHNLSQLSTLSLREKELQSIELLALLNLPISSITCESGLSTYETGPSRPTMDGLYLLHTLKVLCIIYCNSLKDLNSITRLPCLEILTVLECDEIEELVNGQEHKTTEDTYGERCVFHDLQYLCIAELPKLRIISRKDPLPFHSLMSITIKECPLVKKLPLGKHSAGNLQNIFCTLEQWNGLQWDDDNTRKSFQSYLEVTDLEYIIPRPDYGLA